MAYAFFLLLWSAFYIESWKRREVTTAFRSPSNPPLLPQTLQPLPPPTSLLSSLLPCLAAWPPCLFFPEARWGMQEYEETERPDPTYRGKRLPGEWHEDIFISLEGAAHKWPGLVLDDLAICLSDCQAEMNAIPSKDNEYERTWRRTCRTVPILSGLIVWLGAGLQFDCICFDLTTKNLVTSTTHPTPLGMTSKSV